MRRTPVTTEADCKAQVERMLKYSQTKLIMPVLALGVLREHLTTQKTMFSDTEIRAAYQSAVRSLKQHLGHDVHIGAKYEDAYGMRMSRYGFLISISHLRYRLAKGFAVHATPLCSWLPDRIGQHIESRLDHQEFCTSDTVGFDYNVIVRPHRLRSFEDDFPGIRNPKRDPRTLALLFQLAQPADLRASFHV